MTSALVAADKRVYLMTRQVTLSSLSKQVRTRAKVRETRKMLQRVPRSQIRARKRPRRVVASFTMVILG